ncbi:MAG: flavodoxin family protein [Methanofollis sp.]|uniref:flavodoxin family protein n=1 Tax=Methanofollis sp. TaxID=2052835 RepID=UPI00262E754F|nr:flavodoxin family protein [Methanofollis sp.]MDD4256083.1 flavodoxin family protein [Methanofollis sp.]
MVRGPALLLERIIDREYTLSLRREDLSALYPGMVRFALALRTGGETVATFRTNSYEYSPTVPLDAETAARHKAEEWAQELMAHRERFLAAVTRRVAPPPAFSRTDCVIIQGSPRPDGNCSILAGWTADEVRGLGKTVQVVYPDDMGIHPCIGCYQCYNAGRCTFDDDMAGIIGAVKHASLLVVCSPVYTNTVPGGLKIVLDRFQALHAEKNLFEDCPMPGGVLLAVCGRKGGANFACLTAVVRVCMENLKIAYAGEVLVDGVDRVRDVRRVEGLEGRVRAVVRDALHRVADET